MYNPYDLLLLFDSREFAAHWFETGTPAFLVDTLFERRVSSVELGGEALYRLGYPNREVRQSLNEYLLRRLVQDATRQTANSMRLARLLEAVDCAGLRDLFDHRFGKQIPIAFQKRRMTWGQPAARSPRAGAVLTSSGWRRRPGCARGRPRRARRGCPPG